MMPQTSQCNPLDGRFVVTESGCHIWQRAKNSRGYGVVWFDGKVRLAHRVAWFLEHGSWPCADLVLDHACDIKPCVNAMHLREMENWRNLRRAIPRGDEATEARRAGWRRANAKRRGTYRYVEGGE
jgi:hypothetical protein